MLFPRNEWYDSRVRRGLDLMHHAMATKARFSFAISAGRDTGDREGAGFRTILVYCLGPPVSDQRPRCWHLAALKLDNLPEWQWLDILAHLKCTKYGSIGWVDPRPNWCEVIDFNRL